MSQIPSSQTPPARGGSTQLVMIAGVVALVAVILMNVYVEMRAQANAQQTENFFRLTVDRGRGDKLSADDVQMVAIPQSFIRAFGTDAIRESDEYAGIPSGGYEKRIFSVSARAGEIIRAGMFVRDTGNRLGIDLKPGQRLVALPVNTENQPPNLAPDDFIDVYANVMRRNGNTESVMVMEQVQVRLVGSRIVESGADSSRSRNVKYGSITIEVPRSEVAKLADIQNRIAGNQFLVVVRGSGDEILVDEDKPGLVRDEILEMLGLDN